MRQNWWVSWWLSTRSCHDCFHFSHSGVLCFDGLQCWVCISTNFQSGALEVVFFDCLDQDANYGGDKKSPHCEHDWPYDCIWPVEYGVNVLFHFLACFLFSFFVLTHERHQSIGGLQDFVVWFLFAGCGCFTRCPLNTLAILWGMNGPIYEWSNICGEHISCMWCCPQSFCLVCHLQGGDLFHSMPDLFLLLTPVFFFSLLDWISLILSS